MSLKILIAEDEEVSRRILQRMIEMWGHDVIATSDGAEALSELQKTDAPPIAILDLTMPEMDGIEVCKRARETESSAPVYIILLTAKSGKDDIVAGLEAGANDYLTKPFDREELHARLDVGLRVIELQRNLAERVSDLEQALIDRRRAENKLRNSERRYRHLVESSLGLIFTHDMEGNFLSINPAAAKVFGYEPEEIIGKNLRDFATFSWIEKTNEYLAAIQREETASGLFYFNNKDGEERVLVFHNSRYQETDAHVYILGHAQDVTELKRAEEALRGLSLTDDLTGLYNHRGFFAFAEQYAKTIKRSGNNLLFVYADMDGLKKINDTLGHNTGSQALIEVAQILRASFRESDIIARMGGDEFTALASVSSDQNAEHLIERLQQNVQLFNEENKRDYKLSLSVGFVLVEPKDNQSIEELITKADSLMYQQKKSKKAGG
jgi:diguanylate cyclase (GGDEF)-like protein/PAS domain S-box-containing protein